jgi:hypothetical protein
MGRPINKKFFGNRNLGTTGSSDDGIGGEGVASVTITNGGSDYSSATTTVTFSAPQLPTGVTATGTATIVAGVVTGVVITEKGSGYTSAPTVTITDPDGGLAEGAVTLTRTLTNTQENAIYCVAYIPTSGTMGYISGAGGSSAVAGDIVRQVGSNKYVVRTAQGLGRCTLKGGAASAAGEMHITAVDDGGKTYYVIKITAHKARLVPYGAAGHRYASGDIAPWSFAAASGAVVQITNN